MPTDDRLEELADAGLIRRFLAGDEHAFRELYQRHTPRLRMLVLRLLGWREAEADDVVQETWLAGCRNIHQFRGDSKFASWLTTIGVRAASSRFSRAGDRDEPLSDDLTPEPVGCIASVIDLERAIRMLPDHQRAVVVLHDVEGFTHEEIALRLGIAPGTSKATLSRGRRALRGLLQEAHHER